MRFILPDRLVNKGYDFFNGRIRAITPSAGQNVLNLDAAVNCGCANVASDAGSAMGVLSVVVMLLLNALIGLWMIRREEESAPLP